ncbi:MAG: glycoside hydrolase family 15 protein [Acidimicrobiales bacterium]
MKGASQQVRGGSASKKARHDPGPAQPVSQVSDVPIVPAPHVLRDYALLADGHRGVLVGPQGDCSWLCFPGWADPAVFASLIGSGGQYLIQPKGRWVWGGSYEDGTLIWRSRWVTEEGIFESRDALCYPGHPDRGVILRRVQALGQSGTVFVALDLRGDYGRRSLGTWRRRGDVWELRGKDMVARWWGARDAELIQVGRHRRLELTCDLDPGAHRDLVLELITSTSPHVGSLDAPDPQELWSATEDAWRRSVPDFSEVVAQRDVRRSYAVLRGLTGQEGGTVAAATTSLPERADGNRNYDYRYVWIRDTCYVGRAGASIRGGEAMLDDAVRWVTARLQADGDQLSPAYTSDGRLVPGVEKLNLPGYPGGNDVVGNRIADQFQLDAFGEALLLFAISASRSRLGADGRQAAQIAAQAIEKRWTEPDAGIWELEPRTWANSRLTCVAGLRAFAGAVDDSDWSPRYVALADVIAAQVAEDCLHPTGRWQRAVGDPRVDASLLLAQIRGAVAPGDPRSRATRRAVVDELTEDGYVYRYRHEGSPLSDGEGAFLICNFWLALACLDDDEKIEGMRWFERARSSAGSPGLLAEEFDVVQHQLRGNLPQAFVHALLIECAAAQGPI